MIITVRRRRRRRRRRRKVDERTHCRSDLSSERERGGASALSVGLCY